MKKGVVILIIVGTLCYFGMQWYSRKHPEGSKFGSLISMGQWVSSKGKSESEVIYQKNIILETSKEKKAPAKASQESGVRSQKSGVKTQKSASPSSKQEVEPSAPTKPHTIELARLYLKEGKKYEARNLLSDAYLNASHGDDTETSGTNRKQIKERLDKLNEELVFSPNPGKDADVYVVRPGDTLIKIAKQYNTSYELIMRLNKKQNTNLKVNEQLKVLNGKVSLLVDKSDFTQTVLLDGHYIKQYPVGTGVAGKTPVGTFKIKDKLKNPVWYSPEGVYEYGHPKNILGTRWLGFEDKPGLRGYGIHGTTLPDTIGKESSMGCIRMINDDVEELYDFVVPGTEVIIQE
ncbi:MAG TPA: L,D-transpeptidase family protein [Candidatus Brocadiaceae bacterium]